MQPSALLLLFSCALPHGLDTGEVAAEKATRTTSTVRIQSMKGESRSDAESGATIRIEDAYTISKFGDNCLVDPELVWAAIDEEVDEIDPAPSGEKVKVTIIIDFGVSQGTCGGPGTGCGVVITFYLG